MKLYLGHKLIEAEPMTLGEYNKYRGWDIPKEEAVDTLGYLVEYLIGGDANHPNHKGYISWSPKEVFEESYKNVRDGIPFSSALELVKLGYRLQRKGWNGKGMFIFLVQGSNFKVNRPPLLGIYEEGTEINYHPHIDMRTANGQIVPWLCSQTDMLADDWVILEE